MVGCGGGEMINVSHFLGVFYGRHRIVGVADTPPRRLFDYAQKNLLIGERTAEEMKINIGCVYPMEEEKTMEIKGRCLMTGLPRLVSVSSAEMDFRDGVGRQDWRRGRSPLRKD